MWVLVNGGAANLDNISTIQLASTPGQAILYMVGGNGTTGYSVTITFGTTEAEAIEGIARLTQAVDPAIY